MRHPDLQSDTYQYLLDDAPVLLIRLSPDGTINHCNQYAKHMLGAEILNTQIQDLIVDFHSSFDLETLSRFPQKKHLFSIRTRSLMPKSFHFQFKKNQNDILLFGHLDILDNETMNSEMVNMTRELSNLTRELHKKNAQLQDALDHVKTLQGILPICSHCHKIRNDEQVWDRLEKYICDHTDVELSHGICPDCMEKHYSEYLKK